MLLKALAVLRILIGLLLISASIKKWSNPAFFQLDGFANILAQKGAPFPFYKALLDNYIFPNTTTFATLAALGESIIGLSFVIGAFTNPVSIAGMIMILNFCLATCYGRPDKIAGHLFLIGLTGLVGFYSAGSAWGADHFLANKPWSRLVFFPYLRKHKPAPIKNAASA
ncbi:MAG TPA: DoxX family membrane protein [Blastocatellia bacterium]|nr:DoxX family membrane protein [Blastocatellia bacterium]